MLRHIFSFASLAVVHTGIATGFADAHGGHSSPLTTGAISFGGGLIGITLGAFAGNYINDRHAQRNQNKGATLYGLTGYAIGSAAGYFIR